MAEVSGKGISAAVRGAIREWITTKTEAVLFGEYKKLPGATTSEWGFGNRIRQADEWMRIKRYKGTYGWIRTYYSKQFNDRSITLEVRTNADDQLIEFVTILVGGKVIGGGKVKVPSLLISQAGRKAGLTLELAFTPFSEQELLELQSLMEHGDESGMYLLMERDL